MEAKINANPSSNENEVSQPDPTPDIIDNTI
jgi:hypothetical protein